MFCPREPAPLLRDFSLVSPEATFQSFRQALERGSPDYEFRCLSDRLREDAEISFDRYVIGRPYFLRRYRSEIRRFRRSEIVEVEYGVASSGEQLAKVRLSDGEVEAEIVLINEPYWEVHVRGDEGDSPPPPLYDFPERLHDLLEADGGDLLARIPLPRRPRVDPADIVGLELKDEWGVLEVLGLSESIRENQPEVDPPTGTTPEI